MTAGTPEIEWTETVALMRMDVRELGGMRQHAPRFLQRYHASIDGLSAQLRRGWGLNAHEYQAISMLWEFGRMTMTELGRRIPLSRAAVTTLVDRLERLELVTRNADPTDRRRVLLEVTPKVEEGFRRINESWDQRVTAYVDSLDSAAWASVVSVLAGLRELARTEADERRSRAPIDPPQETGGAGPAEITEPDGPRPTYW